jgi:hypothetical protein
MGTSFAQATSVTGNEKYLRHDIKKQTQELEPVKCAGK